LEHFSLNKRLRLSGEKNENNSVRFLVTLALLLSACGAFATESSTESFSTPILPEVSETGTSDALLIWESIDSPCETAAITLEGLSYGKCGDPLTSVSMQVTNHSPRLSELSDLYASFSAEIPAGNLIFRGTGKLVPTDAEKRAMAEWARLMFQIAQTGRTDASWGMAFAWRREAGPGGFCDDVVVYLTGGVRASDCKGYDVQGYLTASQLDHLYAWVDGLAIIDYSQTFPAATGELKMTLALTGNGQKQADDEMIREIFEFAATLYTELGYAAEAGVDVDEAQRVLRDYLMALNSGDYILAAKLYGGNINVLQSWNPDIRDDLPALFERACTQNGLQCLVPRMITYRAPDPDGGYNFYVEFNKDDQTLFQQGPCCGETSGAPVSLFPFLVEKSVNGLLVTDLPPHVP
jgi:hypothetical protein